MSNEQTERLSDGGSFESRVLSELAALRDGMSGLDRRLSSLEEKVDARLRETRPIWEAVLERLRVMDAKFDAFAHDMYEMRAEIILLKKHQPPAA